MKIRKSYLLLFLLLIQLSLSNLLFFFEWYINNFYIPIYKNISDFQQRITSLFSFSVGDVLYALLFFMVLFIFYKIILFLFYKDWNNLKINLNKILIGLNIIYPVFLFVWGINYYKTPLKDKLPTENISLTELKELADSELKKAVFYRSKIKENKDSLFALSMTADDLYLKLLHAQYQLEKYDFLNYTQKIKYKNIKTSFFSRTLNYLGVLGYYNPFTSEAQYNNKTTELRIPFTIAHEISHQIGYASEAEANFVGYLIGTNTKDPYVLYSTHYKTLNSLLNNIVWEDPEYVKSVLYCYSEGMQRDRIYQINFQKKYNGNASDAFSSLNDAFLKLNNQEGIESYGDFIELLIGYYRLKKQAVSTQKQPVL